MDEPELLVRVSDRRQAMHNSETDAPDASCTLHPVVLIPNCSTVKHLTKTLGGEWIYDAGLCGWYCSDGRHLNRCCQRGYGDDFSTEYWMYYPDGQSERGEHFLYENQKAHTPPVGGSVPPIVLPLNFDNQSERKQR